jgi:hypothetical protein
MLSPAAELFMQLVRDIEAQLASGNEKLVNEMLPSLKGPDVPPVQP